MQASLSLIRYLLAALLLWSLPLAAQDDTYIAADLVAEGRPEPGKTLAVALRFRPDAGWHGYWSNPGEAGLGMVLEWRLPEGWEAGEPQYPVPEVLTLFGIVNHSYESDYTVLVPIFVPEQAAVQNIAPITVDARWLACSDELCVPEQATLTLRIPASADAVRADFDAARAAIPPLIDRKARYAYTDTHLRLAIPLPEGLDLAAPHVFVETLDTVDYAGEQGFYRNGNTVIAAIPRGSLRSEPDALSGILAFGEGGEGVRFEAVPGEVPTGGSRLGGAMADTSLPLLLGAALLGGLILNLMPCVFPILSLKALTLARAGESEAQARSEGLAYTAGVMLACIA
ncbi:MAG: protein-disulfide reductase DsbD domain-containing protein, partial [Alteraurantiacibacter sp.]